MNDEIKLSMIWGSVIFLIVISITVGVVANSKFKRDSAERMAALGFHQVVEVSSYVTTEKIVWKKMEVK